MAHDDRKLGRQPADRPLTQRESLVELPNLGPSSAAMLESAGIVTVAQLRALGSVAAYARVKSMVPSASLNLLWGLEGALTGLSWQAVAKAHRTSLLLALEHLRKGS